MIKKKNAKLEEKEQERCATRSPLSLSLSFFNMASQSRIINEAATLIAAEFTTQASSLENSDVELFFTLKNHLTLLEFTFKDFNAQLKDHMPLTHQFFKSLFSTPTASNPEVLLPLFCPPLLLTPFDYFLLCFSHSKHWRCWWVWLPT